MNFEFSEEERQFLREVGEFIEENRHIDVMDLTRENMAQICDTPERRAFMKKLAKRGWLGITWPKEYGGQRGRWHLRIPAQRKAVVQWVRRSIGKGVGIVGKTLINVTPPRRLKREFLPQNTQCRDRVRSGLL